MTDIRTHYHGDGHDHGDPIAPDAFDPALECGAWIKMPRVIGGPSHSHVCRLEPDHWRPTAGDPHLSFLHQCTCGHRW